MVITLKWKVWERTLSTKVSDEGGPENENSENTGENTENTENNGRILTILRIVTRILKIHIIFLDHHWCSIFPHELGLVDQSSCNWRIHQGRSNGA